VICLGSSLVSLFFFKSNTWSSLHLAKHGGKCPMRLLSTHPNFGIETGTLMSRSHLSEFSGTSYIFNEFLNILWGILPNNRLSYKERDYSLVQFLNIGGVWPLRGFPLKMRYSNLIRQPKYVSMVPVNLLEERKRVDSLLLLPGVGRMQLLKELTLKSSSSNFNRWSNSVGMEPVRLFHAKSIYCRLMKLWSDFGIDLMHI